MRNQILIFLAVLYGSPQNKILQKSVTVTAALTHADKWM